MIYTITLNQAIDKIKYLEGNLKQEQNNRVEKNFIDLGGKATHVSAILQQLNQENIALGFAGDMNKEEFYRGLELYEIKHEYIEVRNESVRESIVVINNSGGSYMITEKGPIISKLDKKKLSHILEDKVEGGEIIVIAGSPPPTYSLQDFRELIKILKRNSVYIACDVAGEYLKAALEEQVDFVKPNEHEMNDLYHGEEEIYEKFMKLSGRVKNAVCSLGSEGAMYMMKDAIYQVKPPKVDILSDTGAGDSFVGGYIYGVSQNYSTRDCVKQGIIVSASKVQHYGSCKIDLNQFNYIENNIEILEVR